MPTRLITPTAARRDIRCDVGDAIVANLATHVVFFFERRLDTDTLADAFGRALERLPIFAGRMGLADGRMRITFDGQGVPFTCASSGITLRDAIVSTAADEGLWLVDPVDGVAARWGLGPLCRVRVTHLSDDGTAIGLSWHHAIGDMRTLMIFMNTWAAAAAGVTLPDSVLVEDRASYLDERLPADGASRPGVRCLGLGELARSTWYIAKNARRQKTVSVYFGDDELGRMRDAYERRIRLSTNDVVCAHLAEALLKSHPAVAERTLAIAVNARTRCGLDPMLVGNVLTTLGVNVRVGDEAPLIAERIRHSVDHFADEHCDLRANQRFLDGLSGWQAARCVSTIFNPDQWNPLVSNLSGFDVYRLGFEGLQPCYYTLLLKLPVAGLGVLTEGAGGRGLLFQMALPPEDFDAMVGQDTRAWLHRFRRADDEIPAIHRAAHP